MPVFPETIQITGEYLQDVKDLYVPPSVRSLMRTVCLSKHGKWRLARRHCRLQSVMICSAGAWAALVSYTGIGRQIWMMPSTFTGSFYLGAHCERGFIMELHSLTTAPEISVSWQEADREIV